MPKIKAEICGWSKILEVPNDTFIRGYVEIAILPPLDVIVPPNKVVPGKSAGVTVRLLYAGAEDNLSVFRFE